MQRIGMILKLAGRAAHLLHNVLFLKALRLPLIIALHASRPVYLFIQLMLPIAACVFNVFRVTVYVLTVFLFFSF